MELSIFLAKVLGIYLSVAGLGIFLTKDTPASFMEEFKKSASLRYFGAMLALLFGALIVVGHNVWDSPWQSLITFIGWLALLKGAFLFIAPNWFMNQWEGVNMSQVMRIGALVIYFIGLYLLFAGFGLFVAV